MIGRRWDTRACQRELARWGDDGVRALISQDSRARKHSSDRNSFTSLARHTNDDARARVFERVRVSVQTDNRMCTCARKDATRNKPQQIERNEEKKTTRGSLVHRRIHARCNDAHKEAHACSSFSCPPRARSHSPSRGKIVTMTCVLCAYARARRFQRSYYIPQRSSALAPSR